MEKMLPILLVGFMVVFHISSFADDRTTIDMETGDIYTEIGNGMHMNPSTGETLIYEEGNLTSPDTGETWIDTGGGTNWNPDTGGFLIQE